MRSVYAIAIADRMKTMCITVCAMITSILYELALMKVFSRWMDEMPMMAIASFVFSTDAFTCDSHSGWSGWSSRCMRETNVS